MHHAPKRIINMKRLYCPICQPNGGRTSDLQIYPDHHAHCIKCGKGFCRQDDINLTSGVESQASASPGLCHRVTPLPYKWKNLILTKEVL